MALSKQRKSVMLVVLGGVVCGMVGLSFAAVPLYDLFCSVTGFGGTTQTADAAPETIGERTIAVRFNSDVSNDIPWRFKPSQLEVQLHVGEVGLAFYTAKNESDRTILGSATFNVTPLKAGIYFNKVDCFCFEEQVLRPGESAELPVTFFVDPDIVNDRNLDDVTTITLSYTFFNQGEEALKDYLGEEAQLASRELDGGIRQN
ncbi:MAG: cytochrome c oxidase assembly protein [Rhodospirillaceae bacterium]|jgi:cytochrome c oxidase assembly protein subunit 11|nr:cytochrome c oxidase assembly protein [Rhodospirillaceae bacterium]MBT5038567.1 cytochrome c oxidase assembly protein [Rhodospirillaceae bacterium]MBT5674299.1 cytochrome c oxidase assembly protein [Rhodospirillaceae bacterium]MBT5778394.1 cytochrome c oxidase assembly protein [Rhodospirillaceae bacterium]MBT6831141.1 cytochrome c oxidase assembly protein [Rhodospirillaceae bacterium]